MIGAVDEANNRNSKKNKDSEDTDGAVLKNKNVTTRNKKEDAVLTEA
jgi:hypothetical protein